MANQRLTTDWTDLNTALGLSVGSTYIFQNIGGDDITFKVSPTEPVAKDVGYILEFGEKDATHSITISLNDKIWARGINQDTLVTVLDKDTRVSIKPDPRNVLILPFHTTEQQTTLASPTVIDSRAIVVDNATGAAIGKYILMFSIPTNRFYSGYITNVSGTTLTVDSPLDSVLPAGSNVDIGSTNLNVNGSVTPVKFGVRSPTPGIPATADLYRIMIQMTLATAPDFGKFGDRAALSNGIVLRFKDGTTQNIFNVKTNSQFALLSGDYSPYDAANPGLGVYGVGVRLTFSGDEKMGTVIRVGPGEDLEVIVQDDLTSIVSFSIIAEGNVYNF